MQPDPIVPIPDPRRLPSRDPRPAGVRHGRGAAIAFVATTALLLLAIAPASASTVDRSWRANVGTAGANGAVTVVAYTSGTGAATLRLTSLPGTISPSLAPGGGAPRKVGVAMVKVAPGGSGSTFPARSLARTKNV